jgi:hypothetical protein
LNFDLRPWIDSKTAGIGPYLVSLSGGRYSTRSFRRPLGFIVLDGAEGKLAEKKLKNVLQNNEPVGNGFPLYRVERIFFSEL